MLDIDIGYSVIVSRVKLNTLGRLAERQVLMHRRMTEYYRDLASRAEGKQDTADENFWLGAATAMDGATEMADELLAEIRALTSGSNEDEEKKGAPEDAPLKNHQPHYTTSTS